MAIKKRFGNPALIPSGMLAPSGMAQNLHVDPVVQSTTRPGGSLLRPSPGYDTVRTGNNRFQGKGFTGGFRPSTFAEDVGGSGVSTGAVEPGDVVAIADSEWLPESGEQLDEGSFIISDRNGNVPSAVRKHEGHKTTPDMGDRSPGRPLSKFYMGNPARILREDYAENPVVTVVAAVGVCVLAYIIGNDLDREYRGRRGRGVVSGAVAVPASGAAVAGDEGDKAVKAVGDAADKAVEDIAKAAETAVSAIEDTGKAAAAETQKAAATTT
jgi:hypothetical protein